jgi:hypothetical protein
MLVERAKNGLTILALVATAVLLAAVVLSLARGRPLGYSQAAREQCIAGYRRARSAADSAMVDAWTPVLSRAQAPSATSCAFMRRGGELQPQRPPRDSSRVAAP